jgi:hypothetical protein
VDCGPFGWASSDSTKGCTCFAPFLGDTCRETVVYSDTFPPPYCEQNSTVAPPLYNVITSGHSAQLDYGRLYDDCTLLGTNRHLLQCALCDGV